MPSGSGVRTGQASGSAFASASASAPGDNSDGRISKPSNRDRKDLSYTVKMERIDKCKVIRFPHPINLKEDELPEFTTHQVHMMRALLKNNNVDLSLFSTMPATDDEKRSIELSMAKAYNSTIAEQKRQIINSYKRTPRFTFSWPEWWCYPICKL